LIALSAYAGFRVMARILVVDDNLLIRTLLREILGAGGHDVVAEAANGKQAVAQAIETRPELVTLDLVMPGPDGLEVLGQLRHVDPRVLVIVCSAWLTKPRVTSALRLGANGFVAKPFDRAKLLGTVEQVLIDAHARAAQRQAPPTPGAPVVSGPDRGDERREFDRIAVALPVVLQRGEARVTAWTVDVSGGGMLVVASDFAREEHVRFELTLGPGDPPVVGTARVARASDPERCGLAFEEVAASDYERLIAYIRRQQSATARLAPTS
jgi:two-component system chemotaxis response regulator CheY